jgi:hypothetical protein
LIKLWKISPFRLAQYIGQNNYLRKIIFFSYHTNMQKVDDIVKNIERTNKHNNFCKRYIKNLPISYSKEKNAQDTRMLGKIKHMPWRKFLKLIKARRIIGNLHASYLQDLQETVKYRKYASYFSSMNCQNGTVAFSTIYSIVVTVMSH